MDPISAINSIIPATAASGGTGVSAPAPSGGVSNSSAPQFRIEQLNNRVVVSVIDGTTGQVVQQISSEVWLQVAAMLNRAPTSTFSANG